ncbi:HAMP domain-containing sensor histidine kinase [Virgibacillus oceani]|uniref:Heme sensor protein HssS n=1 Tax=Virgibacillus oceani TaxID=1479511 RepID=A0A917HR49_9BACI|nr:HAMP domain-containing sensor histidine kinase [Virgibacillus oceani]GGG86850.1 two-component sensor histidine kinase [Virgibacillus oceani]
MKTLYVRIIVTTMIIMISSALIAFVISNVYYHYYLKPKNDQKITQIATNIVDIYKHNNNERIENYLGQMTDLGYTFYLVDEAGNETHIGMKFDDESIEHEKVVDVLNGKTYHGIANYPWKLFITGFFSNELKNTVGVPITIDGENHALFVRANTQQQFGEIRKLLAILLVLLLCISFILVLLSTRYIVKPIRTLTEATKKVAGGNYHLKLPVKRQDEIGDLANHFSQMSNSLEKVEEKRQEFVSNVSHEIQSPLTSIQGFSQTLRQENLSENERIQYLEIIEKETKRLSLLSKQLLTLSVLDKDLKTETLLFSLTDQIKEVVLTTQWQWREKEQAIEMELDSANVFGDQKLLHQVWMNLLANAIRYTNPGGTITIKANEDREGVHVVFSDTGIGIESTDLPNLFDRFYKADKSRNRADSSTGLGLAIVKKIIELHDGTIMVESEPGKGSEFRVFLPKP